MSGTTQLHTFEGAAYLDNHAGDDVRVHVRGRPTVLEVSLTLLLNGTADANRCTAVGHAVRELLHRRSLVATGKTALVTLFRSPVRVGGIRTSVLLSSRQEEVEGKHYSLLPALGGTVSNNEINSDKCSVDRLESLNEVHRSKYEAIRRSPVASRFLVYLHEG